MKQNSKEILSNISSHTFNQVILYKFNKGTLKVSNKYREGRLTALQYTAELSLYYMNLEKQLCEQFKQQINKQMHNISCLNEGAYKQGLYDALNEILDTYQEFNY